MRLTDRDDCDAAASGRHDRHSFCRQIPGTVTARGDDDYGAGLRDLVFGFGSDQACIERHDNGPCAYGTEKRDDPFDPVRHPDCDTIAGLHAQRGQATGDGERAFPNSRVCEAVVAINDGDPIREELSRAI